MKFEEENYIEIPKVKRCFIYFLIRFDEVVYVGQTRVGLSRPFAHKDKDYEKIKIICCEEENLDKLENYYILKYEPEYNKAFNHSYIYGLTKVKKLLRKETQLKNITAYQIRKLIRLLDIKIIDAEYYEAITAVDYYKILKLLKEKENGTTERF